MSVAGQTKPDPASPAPSGPNPAAVAWWKKLLVPSMADWLFAALMVWLFFAAAAPQSLLSDGDAGWHIRTGEYVLDHGALPETDPYSFTMEGRRWFAWEWLADVILAIAHRIDGLQGVVLWTAFVIAATGAYTFRYLIWSGANFFLALGGLMMISLVSVSHWLARPHMFTWGLFLATVWLLNADYRRNSSKIWLLVPMAAVWVNLHGGFAALLVTTAVFGFGVGLEQLWEEKRRAEGEFRWFIPPAWLRYSGVLLACAAATLANPFGYQLHLHIADYLQSDFILKHVHEFQAPDFRSDSDRVLEIAILLGLLICGRLFWKGEFARPLLVLAWTHAVLLSGRHGALFMLAAVPVIVVELTVWFNEAARRFEAFKILKEVADDYGAGGAAAGVSESGLPVVNPLAIVTLIAMAVLMNVRTDQRYWKAEFPDVHFPVAARDALADRMEGRRVLTTDQWGDYFIYHLHPRFKVFVDGRSDFYDPRVLNDYVSILGAAYNWRRILDRYEFDAVLAPKDWVVTSALKESADWEATYDDGFAVFFERKGRNDLSELGAVEGREASMIALGCCLAGPGDTLRAP